VRPCNRGKFGHVIHRVPSASCAKFRKTYALPTDGRR
jgi:hypothetical protein